MRALLISNSGRPFLEHCRAAIADFLGPACRVGFVTAASLNNEKDYCERARVALGPVGLSVEHVHWNREPLGALQGVDAIFVGGGKGSGAMSEIESPSRADDACWESRSGWASLNVCGATAIVE